MRSVYLFPLLVLLFVLNGCSPSVKIQRLKPAEVDMSSTRRLAIPDFKYYRGELDSVEDIVIGIIANSVGVIYGEDYKIREAASYATDELINILKTTDYFEIVDSSSLSITHSNVDKAFLYTAKELGAEAVFIGEIRYAGCDIEEFIQNENVYDSQLRREVVRQTPWLDQNCRLTLSYSVIRIQENILVIRKQFTEYRNEQVEASNRINLHDPEYWYKNIIDEIIPKIRNQLAPYTVYETRSLKDDKLNDPEVERALLLAKEGNLEQAQEIFYRRWRLTSNPAAGYNAAILYEVEGDLENAATLLDEVIKVSNDQSIRREYKLVLDALEDQKLAEMQIK